MAYDKPIHVPTVKGKYDIHGDKTGKFISEDGEYSSEEGTDLASELLSFELDEDLIGLEGDSSETEGESPFFENPITEEQEAFIESLGYGDVELSLIHEFHDLDKDKIMSANEEELRALLKAKIILQNKDKQLEFDKELNELKKEKFDGLWKDVKDASDYEELSTTKSKGADFTRFEAKREYIQNSLSPDKDEKLQKLDRLEDLGKQYLERKKEIDSSYSGLQTLVDKFTDTDSPYSEARKSAAKILESPEEAKEKFDKGAKALISELEKSDYKALDSVGFYTGSFSVINEPLRGVTYGKTDPSPYGFLETVKAMTRAIEKSTFDFDYTLERGCGHINLSDGTVLGSEMSLSELKEYIGSEFKQQSFCSGSAVKGASISDKKCNLNIYCPKGTKGMYVYDIARHKPEQYEVILQRGYSYKITDVYYKNGKVNFDCEVILGSDSEKYDDKRLEEIEKERVPYGRK